MYHTAYILCVTFICLGTKLKIFEVSLFYTFVDYQVMNGPYIELSKIVSILETFCENYGIGKKTKVEVIIVFYFSFRNVA